MSNRQPADQRADQAFSRTGAAVARSPAERLEPTRPPTRPRRRRLGRLEGERRRASPLLRVLNAIFTLALLLMLLVGGIAYLFDSQIDAPGPLERSKVVAIPKSEGAHEIAFRLEREGVVSDRRLFIAGYLWAKFAAWMEGGKAVQLRAGEYGVKQNASIRQVIDLLSEGKTISYKVTVPEGLTSHQIVERLKADANLSGEIAAVPPEGALLPETFVVERGAARQSIIDRMQAEARKLADKAWAQRKNGLPLKTLEEAIILASIVEKETGRNDERERVAAVFYNRLKINMRLQSDPTILYGLTGGKTVWSRPIQKIEIMQKVRAQHLPDRRAAADADLQPGPRRDRGRPQSRRHEGPLFRRRRQRRPRVRRDAQGAQRQRSEMAGGGEGQDEGDCSGSRRHARYASCPCRGAAQDEDRAPSSTRRRRPRRSRPPTRTEPAPAKAEVAKELPWAPKPKP